MVRVRLMALAALFHGFAEFAWQEGEVDLSLWASELEVSRVRLLQWLGPSADPDSPLDDEQLLEWAFDEVYEKAYNQVVNAVFEGFGGVDRTFASLWLSRNPNWSGRADLSEEMFSEIVNAPTSDKLAAYGWLAEQPR